MNFNIKFIRLFLSVNCCLALLLIKPAFAGSDNYAAVGFSHFGSQSVLLSSVRSRLVCTPSFVRRFM